MVGSLLIVVLFLALLLLGLGAVVAVVVVALRTRSSSGTVRPGVRDSRRGLLRVAGMVVGLLAAWLVAGSDSLGRGLLLAAPVAALGLLLGVLAAELVVRPPAGPRRTASLTTRRVTDYLPRRLSVVVTATGVTLGVLTAVTTALGSADDMGRPGRSLAYACSAVQTASRGPWPGWYYTWPLLLVVGVGVLLALLVLHASVARPPLLPEQATGPLSPDRAQTVDADLRAQSARAVVAGLGVLFALPLAGMSAIAAMAVGGMSGCAPGWWVGVGAALAVLSLAAVLVLLWCVVVALLGRRATLSAVAPAEQV